jgi:hypothetical protein
MKTQFSDSLLRPAIRAGINCGRIREAAVETGIEYGNLRDRSAEFFD